MDSATNTVPPGGSQQSAAAGGGGNNNRRSVRHVPRACDTCRRRKCRCDGREPECAPCNTFNLDCSWTGDDKRRHGHSKLQEELAELRARVTALEKQVAGMNGTQGATQPVPQVSLTIPEGLQTSPLTPVSPLPSTLYSHGGSLEMSPNPSVFGQLSLPQAGGLLTVPPRFGDGVRYHHRSLSGLSTDSESGPQSAASSMPPTPNIPSLVMGQATSEANSPVVNVTQMFSGMGVWDMNFQLPATDVAGSAPENYDGSVLFFGGFTGTKVSERGVATPGSNAVSGNKSWDTMQDYYMSE